MKYWHMSFWYPKLEPWTFRSIPVDIPEPMQRALRENWNPDLTKGSALLFARVLLNKYPEVRESLAKAISELGGRAFVRTDICAPKDIMHNPIREREGFSVIVTEPEKVIALLLASERIGEMHYFLEKEPIKRVWLREVPKAGRLFCEVRAFIRGYKLIAVSQYDYKQYDRKLHDDVGLPIYVETIKRIIESMRLREKGFPSRLVMDFCMTCPLFPVDDVIRLVEVNPWCPDTDPCLFSWDELESMDAEKVKVRIVVLSKREIEV